MGEEGSSRVKYFLFDKKNIVITIMAITISILVSSFFVRKENLPDTSESVIEKQKLIDSDVAGVQTEPSKTPTATKESSLNIFRVTDVDKIFERVMKNIDVVKLH